MQAVILAGGLGHRLRPFTEVIPKPLLPLGETAIIELQIRSLARAGASDVFVATNYMSDLIEAYVGDGSKFGVPVHISKEEEPLGTCGPLKLLQDRLTGPFVVMNGDILTKLDLRQFCDTCLQDPALLTVGTKIITTPFRFGNVQVNDEGAITSVEEKPEFNLEIVAGIYCMRPEILDLIPAGSYYGMDSLIKDMLHKEQRIGRYLIQDYWLDIGQVDDYSQARQEYLEHFTEPKESTSDGGGAAP